MWNLPNCLSYSRVVAVFVIAGLLPLGSGWAYLAFAVFVVAALTDGLDGWTARKFNMITTLGKFLDALVDKIFVIGTYTALLAAFLYVPDGLLSVSRGWLAVILVLGLLIMLVREFAVSGLRMLAAQRQVVLAAEAAGKVKTALQMGSAAVLILAYAAQSQSLEGAPGWAAVLLWVGLLGYLLSVGLTLTSGMGYFKRYGHLLQDEEAPK